MIWTVVTDGSYAKLWHRISVIFALTANNLAPHQAHPAMTQIKIAIPFDPEGRQMKRPLTISVREADFKICGLTGLTWSMPATDATRANATNGPNLTTMPMVFWLLFIPRIRPYRSTLAQMPLHINGLHMIFMTSALMPILERLLPRLSQPSVLRMADNSTTWNGQWLIGLFKT